MKESYDKTFFFREMMRVQRQVNQKPYQLEKIIAAKQFIDEHYSEELPLDKLSRAAMLSKFHFIRLFKETYGRTPHQYLISIRMFHAKKLLASHYTVAESCALTGFGSVTSFAALFKKMTGKSPIAYKTKKAILKSII